MSCEQPEDEKSTETWIHVGIEEFDTLKEAKAAYPTARCFFNVTLCQACRSNLLQCSEDQSPDLKYITFSQEDEDIMMSETVRRDDSELVIRPCYGMLGGKVAEGHKGFIVCKKVVKKIN
jgi:hypothetical protein